MITHPEKPGFNYRIPLRWLDKKCPDPEQSHSYYHHQITLSFNHLQKLASYVECKFTHNEDAMLGELNATSPVSSQGGDKNIDGKDIRRTPKNLESNPSNTKGIIRL